MKNYKQLRKTIKTFLAKNYPDYMKTEIIDENLQIAEMTAELENENLISFAFNFRENESGCDCWLQCEYFSKKINKSIIWDYDAPSYFDNQDIAYAIDCFIDILIDYQKAIDKFEKNISLKKENKNI